MHLNSDEINRLSPPERLIIIEQLWDSLKDSDVPVTAAQQDELIRRLETFSGDKSQGITWEKLKTDLAQRHS